MMISSRSNLAALTAADMVPPPLDLLDLTLKVSVFAMGTNPPFPFLTLFLKRYACHEPAANGHSLPVQLVPERMMTVPDEGCYIFKRECDGQNSPLGIYKLSECDSPMSRKFAIHMTKPTKHPVANC